VTFAYLKRVSGKHKSITIIVHENGHQGDGKGPPPLNTPLRHCVVIFSDNPPNIAGACMLMQLEGFESEGRQVSEPAGSTDPAVSSRRLIA